MLYCQIYILIKAVIKSKINWGYSLRKQNLQKQNKLSKLWCSSENLAHGIYSLVKNFIKLENFVPKLECYDVRKNLEKIDKEKKLLEKIKKDQLFEQSLKEQI